MCRKWDTCEMVQTAYRLEAQQTQQGKRNTTVEEKWKQFNLKK